MPSVDVSLFSWSDGCDILQVLKVGGTVDILGRGTHVLLHVERGGSCTFLGYIANKRSSVSTLELNMI